MTVSESVTLSPRERAVLLAVLSRFAADIGCAAIFGSRALGTARPASDIDLVLYGTLDDRAVARLWTMFNESILAVTVDVVRYESLGDTPFRRHIDICGRQVFSHEELMAAVNEVRAA